MDRVSHGDRVIELRSAPGIPADVRALVQGAVHWLRRTQPVPHRLIVSNHPEPAIGAHGGAGFAAFAARWDVPRTGVVWILMGCGVVELAVDEWEMGREEAETVLLECLFHEFAHYEHWRDGRERPTERGVQVRAKNLLRQYRAHAPGVAA